MSHRYGFTMLTLPALVRGSQLFMPPDDGPLCADFRRPRRATRRSFRPCRRTSRLCCAWRSRQPGPRASAFPDRRRGPAASHGGAVSRISGRPVHAFYGASECGGICYDRDGDAAERGTVGTPVEGVSISRLMPADPDGEGLMAVVSERRRRNLRAGAGRAAGRRPVPDRGPRRVARLPRLQLLRRADRVINVRGFKVDPRRSRTGPRSLPGVEDVVVTGTSGADGLGTLVRAVVACRPGCSTPRRWPRGAGRGSPNTRSRAASRWLKRCPRTSRGKIDRAALIAIRPLPVYGFAQHIA